MAGTHKYGVLVAVAIAAGGIGSAKAGDLLSGAKRCQGNNVTGYLDAVGKEHIVTERGVCSLHNPNNPLDLREGTTADFRAVVEARFAKAKAAFGAACISKSDAWGNHRTAIADLLCSSSQQYTANFKKPCGVHRGDLDYPGGHPHGCVRSLKP